MNVEQLAFLQSEEGMRALDAAAQMPPDRLTRLQRLRREYSDAHAAGVVELLELRTRARAKFSQADRMFFTPEGLEQSTGETIAAYRAGRFPADAPILDACCGIGGDALHLQRRGRVLAVDRNPAAAACALANAQVLSSRQNDLQTHDPDTAQEEYSSQAGENNAVHALCADVTALDLARLRAQGIRSAFFDPSRRIDAAHGRARARDAEDYLPPLSWLNALRAHFPFAAAKVSPAIDDATLAQTGGWVEFIADGRECKEAVVWLGEAKDTFGDPEHFAASRPDEPYCATVLRPNLPPQTLFSQHADAVPVSAPRAWLYEPNPAVIRAHLVPQVAISVRGLLLDPQIAYLIADDLLPTPFAAAYRVLDWMPYHAKNAQAWLRASKRRVDVVKKRGVALEPEEVRKKLASPALADAPPVTLVLARQADRTIALFCEPYAQKPL